MEQRELEKTTKTYLNQIATHLVHDIDFKDAISRVYKDENGLGIERHDIPGYNPIQGYDALYQLHITTADAHLLFKLANSDSGMEDFAKKFIKAKENESKKLSYEVTLEDLEIKVGMKVYGHTRDSSGNYESVKNPLLLPSGTGLEPLTILYAVPIDKEVEPERQINLLKKYTGEDLN